MLSATGCFAPLKVVNTTVFDNHTDGKAFKRIPNLKLAIWSAYLYKVVIHNWYRTVLGLKTAFVMFWCHVNQDKRERFIKQKFWLTNYHHHQLRMTSLYLLVLPNPSYYRQMFIMMTSSNGNIFCVTGHLCEEFMGHRWIPCTKASDVELWCSLWSASSWLCLDCPFTRWTRKYKSTGIRNT